MEIQGVIKYTQLKELVAEISQRDAAYLHVGKSVITVAGVTGRVKRLGNLFKGKQYAYLADVTGEVPTKPEPTEFEFADGGDFERRNAI